MKRLRRVSSITLTALACFGALAGVAQAAEETTPPPPLPFDPLALELVLPGSTVHNNFWDVRSLSSSSKPIGSLTYTWNGQTKTIFQLMLESGTDALLAVDNGKIAYEKYFDINNVFTQHQSFSMMKSFTSAMIGIAIRDGYIGSINDQITSYVPALAANGYNGVTIKEVLQMSSGVGWHEGEDVVSLMAEAVIDNLTFGVGGRSLDEFSTSPQWQRVAAPGTQWNYKSLDTQVLGMVLAKATGRPVYEYLEEKIWKPSGMASNARLLHDRTGRDFTFANFYATARDYARFGLVFENNGARGSRQIVPSSWVYDSTHSTAAHLHPGAVRDDFGYGYQWWLGNGARGDFFAAGYEGQFIYVSPADDTVIVKLSDDLTLDGDRASEVVKAFRVIADYLRTH